MTRGRRGQPENSANGGPVGMELIIPNPKLKLLEQVKEGMRLRHYSIRTEQCYCDWIRRYVKFHGMRSREELLPACGKVETFLSDLAVNGNVSASTQNQAFNARRIRDRAEFSATTWMRPRSKRRSGQPLCVAGLRSEPAATRSGTASRRTRFSAG